MQLSQLQTIADNFYKELKDAQAGKKTSLPFIRHQLSLTPKVKKGEVFQVLRIGGSIYQNARVKRINGKIAIERSVQQPLPVFKTEDMFLSFIDRVLDTSVDHLALNFAYPMTPLARDGYLDGTLVSGSKEHAFDGLVGHAVGDSIERYIKDKQKRTIHAALANDTVCLLLSGLTQFPRNNLVAGVIGTGLNFAIFLDERTLVNLESANFNKFPQSPEGKLIDQGSNHPGTALFEKEISGGYLYKNFNIRLAKEGLNYPNVSSTKEMDNVAFNDIPKVSLLAREVSEHSSSLVSCQIAGITQFYNRDCTVIIEGSLFWKGYRYKENVGVVCRQLVPDHQVSFVFIEESGILGAAKLIS